MNLIDQVITLEQAKKLVELWFDWDNLFWHYKDMILDGNALDEWAETYLSVYKDAIPAYTASELMDILPDKFLDYYLTITKWKELYYISYKKFKEFHHRVIWNNLVQALWDMLIYLLENNYIE